DLGACQSERKWWGSEEGGGTSEGHRWASEQGGGTSEQGGGTSEEGGSASKEGRGVLHVVAYLPNSRCIPLSTSSFREYKVKRWRRQGGILWHNWKKPERMQGAEPEKGDGQIRPTKYMFSDNFLSDRKSTRLNSSHVKMSY